LVLPGNRKVDRRLRPDRYIGEKPEPYCRQTQPKRENPLFGGRCCRDRPRRGRSQRRM